MFLVSALKRNRTHIKTIFFFKLNNVCFVIPSSFQSVSLIIKFVWHILREMICAKPPNKIRWIIYVRWPDLQNGNWKRRVINNFATLLMCTFLPKKKHRHPTYQMHYTYVSYFNYRPPVLWQFCSIYEPRKIIWRRYSLIKVGTTIMHAYCTIFSNQISRFSLPLS